MIAHKEIIKTINNLKTQNIRLSKDGILKILNATKNITPHKDTVDSLIFFLTTYESHATNEKKLTKRELQILRRIGNGETSYIIAEKLNLSLSTIETHRKNIRKKLNLIGKGKLVEYAILHKFKLKS